MDKTEFLEQYVRAVKLARTILHDLEAAYCPRDVAYACGLVFVSLGIVAGISKTELANLMKTLYDVTKNGMEVMDHAIDQQP